MFGNADVENANDYLPSWIPDNLGEKSYMEDEVIKLPSLLRKETSIYEDSPLVAPIRML